MKTKPISQRGRKVLPASERKEQFIAYIKREEKAYLVQRFGNATNAMQQFVKMLRSVGENPNPVY